jgi:hypothetical protein
MAGSRSCDERVGWIDRGDLVLADSSDELGGEGAWAAADIQHTPPGSNAREVGELRGELLRVAAHETVIGLGRHLERHCASLGCVALKCLTSSA